MPEGTTTDGYRLPTTVVPRAYDLSLTPDLDTATFSGTAEVAVDVTEPVERLVLHALDLDIDEAWLERDGERLARHHRDRDHVHRHPQRQAGRFLPVDVH